MDTLQLQISELREKVDSLHELIERMSYQLNGLSAAKEPKLERDSYSLSNFARHRTDSSSWSEESGSGSRATGSER